MTFASLIPILCGVFQFYIRNRGGTKSDIVVWYLHMALGLQYGTEVISKSSRTHAISGGKHVATVATVEPTHQALKLVSTNRSSRVCGTICFDASVSMCLLQYHLKVFPLLRHLNAFDVIWLFWIVTRDFWVNPSMVQRSPSLSSRPQKRIKKIWKPRMFCNSAMFCPSSLT